MENEVKEVVETTAEVATSLTRAKKVGLVVAGLAVVASFVVAGYALIKRAKAKKAAAVEATDEPVKAQE